MTFAEQGIEIPSAAFGPEVLTQCPKCSGERRKKSAKCLSVNTEKRVWVCHHCGWTGGLQDRPRDTPQRRRPEYRRPDPRPQLTLPQNAVDWFRSRAITDAVLLRNRIDYGRAYYAAARGPQRDGDFPILPKRRACKSKVSHHPR